MITPVYSIGIEHRLIYYIFWKRNVTCVHIFILKKIDITHHIFKHYKFPITFPNRNSIHFPIFIKKNSSINKTMPKNHQISIRTSEKPHQNFPTFHENGWWSHKLQPRNPMVSETEKRPVAQRCFKEITQFAVSIETAPVLNWSASVNGGRGGRRMGRRPTIWASATWRLWDKPQFADLSDRVVGGIQFYARQCRSLASCRIQAIFQMCFRCIEGLGFFCFCW